jgi:hypothetical protein
MRSILAAVLFGVFLAAAPAADPPFPRDRDRDSDRDRDRDRGVSRQAREQVTDWSVRFFGQKPDENSMLYWGRMLDRIGADQTLAAMLGSNDCYLRTGGRPRDYVQAMFRSLAGRDPSRREFDFWMGRLFQSGGEAPTDADRTDMVYDMLRRYPQSGPPPRADDDYDYRGPGARPNR